MPSNTEKTIIAAAAAAALYLLLNSAPKHVSSQREQFMQDLRDLDNIPTSLWDPLHTPVPGDWNWEYNYNRS